MTPEFWAYLALCAAAVAYLIPEALKVSREHREALNSRDAFLESTEGRV